MDLRDDVLNIILEKLDFKTLHKLTKINNNFIKFYLDCVNEDKNFLVNSILNSES